MGKSSNFIGQPLFNQLIKLISRQKIQEIAQKGGYNRYVKRFDGYSHLVTLLFAVFSRYDSLREIVLGLMSEALLATITNSTCDISLIVIVVNILIVCVLKTHKEFNCD